MSAFRHTSVCFEKNPVNMNRDPTRDPWIWKETYKWGLDAPKMLAFRHTSVSFEKNPMKMERDLRRNPWICKETYKWGLDATKMSAFRHTRMFWKEPYENGKRPTSLPPEETWNLYICFHQTHGCVSECMNAMSAFAQSWLMTHTCGPHYIARYHKSWHLTPENHRSLLENIVSFIGLFCKRDV